MAHQACLAVHRARGAGDSPANHLANTLMAKTNSENRHAPGIFPHEPHRHSRLVRRARSRRNYDGFGYLARQGGIVAHDFRYGTQFTEIIGDRVHERIVIVDDENHLANSFAPKASNIALALSSVSSYSAAGSADVTIPPPACTTQGPPRKLAVRMTMLVSMVPSNPI